MNPAVVLSQFSQSFGFFIFGFAALQLFFSLKSTMVSLGPQSVADEVAKIRTTSHPVIATFAKRGNHGGARRKTENVAELLRDSVRILCLILTTEYYHTERAFYSARTWGRKCTKLVFVSDFDDPSVPARNFSIGPDYTDWSSVWNKVRSSLEWAHREHLNDFDWFIKADDDSFLFLENMRFFLAHYDPGKAHFFGRHFFNESVRNQHNFPHGGAGYVFSRKALDVVVKTSFKNANHCAPVDALVMEDVEIGRCVQTAGIAIGDSRDRLGRQRFFYQAPWNPLTVGNIPKNTTIIKWDVYPYVDGEACCSDIAMTFHYLPGKYQNAVEYLLYRLKVAGVDADFNFANLT